jgi:hypothetical protein
MRDTIVQAASKAGFDSNLLLGTVAMESDFKSNANAGTSSAKGPLQFTDATWTETVGKYGSRFGLDPNTASPYDLHSASLMAASYYKANLPKLESSLGRKASVTDAYLTHLLGPNGSLRFVSALKSSPNEIAAKIMPAAAKSNYNLFYANGQALTVKQVYDQLNAKVQKKLASYGLSAGATELASNSSPTSLEAPKMSNALYEPGVAAAAAPMKAAMGTAPPTSRPSTASSYGMAPPREALNAKSVAAQTNQTDDLLAKSLKVEMDMLATLKNIEKMMGGRVNGKTESKVEQPAATQTTSAPTDTYTPPKASVSFRRSA